MTDDDIDPSDFSSFWEGLSLRPGVAISLNPPLNHFPSFLEGLSMRRAYCRGVGSAR